MDPRTDGGLDGEVLRGVSYCVFILSLGWRFNTCG